MNQFISPCDFDLMMDELDLLVRSDRWQPYKGWDKELQLRDRAAFQQDRREFAQLLTMLDRYNAIGGSCLQLGMGPSGASHEVWRKIFDKVVTIDLAVCAVDDRRTLGMDTHSHSAMLLAAQHAPYDFLFIDAGHSLQDVAADYYTFAHMVRSGGLIAFHDALERDGYPEVEVHKFIKNFQLLVTIFGDEVGTAVMVKT